MRPRLEIWRGRKIDTSWAMDYLKTSHEPEKPRLIHSVSKESAQATAKQPQTNTDGSGQQQSAAKTANLSEIEI